MQVYRAFQNDLKMKHSYSIPESGVTLVAEETNLVDLVWPGELRPPFPSDPIYIHELNFAGVHW